MPNIDLSALEREAAAPVLDEQGMRALLLSFARDLNRVYHRERTRAEELERALLDLEESYLATVQTLAFVVEAKDADTKAHLGRAHDYAVALAQRVDPDLADDRVFRYGFLLHDIGKVGVPEQILRKQGPLSDEEWAVMQTHPLIGGQILQPIRFLKRAIPIVECHHERWDGEGYPRRLARDDIPLAARIFAVVDAFDAITSDRPYRRALSVEQAVDEISRAAGAQFDPDVTKEFAELCSERVGLWPLHDSRPSVRRQPGGDALR